MSLNKEYAEMIQEQSRKLRLSHPLISGPEFKPLLHKKSRWSMEYELLLEKTSEMGWQNPPRLLEPLHNPDTAIILTDAEQNIEWVNQGFYRMTGYSLGEIAGKNPRILQGKDTSEEELHKIRKAQDKLLPVSAELLNYRKNGESYHCLVNIFPLFNEDKQLVNFIAIENEKALLENF